MIKLFKPHYTPLRRSMVFTKMPYISKRIKQNIQLAKQYYLRSGEAVDSSHPLVTLINSISVAWAGDAQRFMDVVDALSPAVCGTVRIGTNMHNPILRLRGIFYGDSETVISTTLDRKNIARWYEIVPVKVCSHGRTDISYSLPDGDTNTNEDSYSVIAVDVALLMYMYINWVQWQRKTYPDATQGVPHFIANFVLPNMLESHNDCSWLNRIRYSLAGVYTGVPREKKRTPFALATSETFTQATLEEIVNYIRRTELDWADVLKLIVLPSGQNALEFSTLQDAPPTRLGRALDCLQTLDKVELLVQTQPAVTNSGYLVDLRRQIDRNASELWFQDSRLRKVIEERFAAIASIIF